MDPTMQSSNRYALVSSLYGPGTIGSWYLTLASIFVSWTLNHKKRRSGSIDVDLIAVLTLPAVAAAHVAIQVRSLIHRGGNTIQHNDSGQYAQVIAAVEAPLTLIESFMPISVVLFLLSIWTYCIRRAVCVAAIGLVCLATECYVHFSGLEKLGISYRSSLQTGHDSAARFTRSFVADFFGLIVAILAVLAACVTTSSVVVGYCMRRQKPHTASELAERGERYSRRSSVVAAIEGRARTQTRTRPQSAEPARNTTTKRAVRASAWTSLLVAPSAFLTIVPTAGNTVYFTYQVLVTATNTHDSSSSRTVEHVTFWARLKFFAAHFWPQSANSFSDLDQAVALAAGATVLACSIYSVAKAKVEAQRKAQRELQNTIIALRARRNANAVARVDATRSVVDDALDPVGRPHRAATRGS
jgi:hypothetical protein